MPRGLLSKLSPEFVNAPARWPWRPRSGSQRLPAAADETASSRSSMARISTAGTAIPSSGRSRRAPSSARPPRTTRPTAIRFASGATARSTTSCSGPSSKSRAATPASNTAATKSKNGASAVTRQISTLPAAGPAPCTKSGARRLPRADRQGGVRPRRQTAGIQAARCRRRGQSVQAGRVERVRNHGRRQSPGAIDERPGDVRFYRRRPGQAGHVGHPGAAIARRRADDRGVQEHPPQADQAGRRP